MTVDGALLETVPTADANADEIPRQNHAHTIRGRL